MTPEEAHSLDCLIVQNRCFAIYRIPGEDLPRFLMQESGEPGIYNDLAELDGQTGFVMAPFAISESSPLVLIRPDRWTIPPRDELTADGAQEIPSGAISGPDHERYRLFFSSFLAPLKDGVFDKLVLSQSAQFEREPGFSPARAFDEACRRYPQSYVYLCHTPHTGTWLGSTPEVLLSAVSGRGHTVALAGTQSLCNGKLPETWDAKNTKEQSLVTDYVRKQLARYGVKAVENGPYAIQSGELAHLRSDFDFSLTDSEHYGALLKLLHPTPAVCGLPKEEAYRFILDNEGYDRRYYSGFAGWLDPGGKTDLYVNLRCMGIAEDSLALYAGGGILPSSTEEQEYQEWRDKLQTMLALINHNSHVLQ